VIGRFRV